MKLLVWLAPDTDPVRVTVRRSWLGGIWGHDSWVFRRTVWTRLHAMPPEHLRHELAHVAQYVHYGVIGFLWRYWFGQRQRLEAEARAAELSEWPLWAVR